MIATKPIADFIEEAMRIVKLAEKRGMILRVMGACAVRLHCPEYEYLRKELGRELSDLDFVSYDASKPKMEEFFEQIGYKPRKYITSEWAYATGAARRRHIYDDMENRRVTDVFFDKLEMCHTIDFRGRLELDYPTITLADLLLTKMQIVKLTEKDVKDVIILLREHEVGEKDEDTVNAKYLAKLLSRDWGFCYTIIRNLDRVKKFLSQYEALTEKDREDLTAKINRLLQAIEKEPKSLRWKMRAEVGTRKKWYTEVGEAVLPGAPLEK